jgi:hypothetical protein
MDDNLEWITPGPPPLGGPANTGTEPGEPDPKPRRGGRARTIRTVAIATVTAGALALVGVSVASAQSSGTTTTKPATTPSTTAPTTTAPKPGARRGPGGFRGGPGFPGPGGPGGFGPFGAGGSIHGEFTRRSGTGYQTVDTQVGTVQTVSTTSITVKSADGFTQTYTASTNTVVNSGQLGINSVKVNDTVQVEAVVTGSGSTLVRAAESIVDTTSLGNIRGHWNPPRPATPATPPTTTG